jgi:hypothetical protein
MSVNSIKYSIHKSLYQNVGRDIKSKPRKPKGKKQLGIPRHRWEDNVKMDFKEIRCEDMDSIHLAEDRVQWLALVKTVMNLRAS